MKKNVNIYFTTIASILYQLPSSAATTPGNTYSERPNLLVVMADQFRGDAFGFRGKEVVKTPNFDSFSKMRLTKLILPVPSGPKQNKL